MSTIEQVAIAFATGKPAQCHNARTDGMNYWLHGHRIATFEDVEDLPKESSYQGFRLASFDWCGWHTPTTANHLNHIAESLDSRYSRFSYAQARDGRTPERGYFK